LIMIVISLTKRESNNYLFALFRNQGKTKICPASKKAPAGQLA
jgi:hypothetical protein